jgi:hypothetical protein
MSDTLTGRTVANPKQGDEGGGDGGANSTKSDLTYYITAWALGLCGLYATLVHETLSPRVLGVVVSPPPGTEPSLEAFGLCMLFVFAGVGVCATVDLLVGRWFAGRYFAMHVVLNALIIAASLHDALRFFAFGNPLDANTCFGASGALACGSKVGIGLTFAVHIWHCFAFEVKGIDIIHHVPSFFACAHGLHYGWGPALNFTLVFTLMGVPGMIDYALLVGVKQKWWAAGLEKRTNQTLNVWIRCPFAVVSGYVIMLGAVTSPTSFSSAAHRVSHFLIGVHNVWNGCFFMYRTVDALTRFTLTQKYPALADAIKAEKAAKAAAKAKKAR